MDFHIFFYLPIILLTLQLNHLSYMSLLMNFKYDNKPRGQDKRVTLNEIWVDFQPLHKYQLHSE